MLREGSAENAGQALPEGVVPYAKRTRERLAGRGFRVPGPSAALGPRDRTRGRTPDDGSAVPRKIEGGWEPAARPPPADLLGDLLPVLGPRASGLESGGGPSAPRSRRAKSPYRFML